MSRISPLDPATATEAQLRVYRAITEGPRAQGPQDFALTNPDGSLAGPFDALARAGALGDAVQGIGEALRFAGTLDARSRELAILVVAATWSCPFEWYAHEPIARRAGLDATTIDALAAGSRPPALSSRQNAVYETAHELSKTRALSDETFASVREHIEEGEMIELFILIGYYTLLAGVLNGLDIPLPDPAARTPFRA